MTVKQIMMLKNRVLTRMSISIEKIFNVLNGVEKRLVTVVFWESHISELCEKWIDSWDN